MTLNWGVLSSANIAVRSVIPAILSVDGNSVKAIASRSLATARKAAAAFGCEALEGYGELVSRQDIDALYIPLPNALHYEWVLKALNAGKHVLVEKAAATSLPEAEDMVQAARVNERVLVENFQFLHHRQHHFVKDLIAKGVIGEVRCFRSSFGFPPFDAASNIRYKKELGGGALLDAGAYTVRASVLFLGEELEVKGCTLAYHDEYDVDWFGGAFLAQRNGSLFAEVAFGFENYYQCNYEIWGSAGKITSTRAFTAKADFAPSIIIEAGGKAEEKVLATDDHFHNAITHFNKLVKEGTPQQEWQSILMQARLLDEMRALAERSRRK